MEDDIDIYADLPSVTSDKSGQTCNCDDIKKELNSLKNALENIQKEKENLENNLFSLLKTAKAEIVRKDKIIDDLRKRLDDITFRRNNKVEFQSFSARKQSHHIPTVVETYETVSSTYPYENENDELNQTELHYDKCKRKSEKSVDQISTVFGERLYKKVMKDEKEEKKVTTLTLNPEISTRKTSKENILESNKENGSQPNKNDNESNIAIKSYTSEISYKNNSERKRTNEEDDMRANKRIKIEDNKNVIKKSDHDFTQYDLKDSFAQNETKVNSVKLEDRLDAVHSFKKERASFDARYRAISEHKDVKHDQYYTNERRKGRSNSRDHDDRRRKSSDRYSWTTSASERSSSNYKKSNHRYNSHSRSHSSSRSNQESLSSHRIRSSNTHRDRKYDDFKIDRRHRSERSKRDYNSREDGETRSRSRDRSNLRDSSRYVPNNVEDGESGNLYKNSKYEKRRPKEAEAANVSDNKRSHNGAAVETDFQTSSRTFVNTVMSYSDRKDADQRETKSESDIKSVNIENTEINGSSNLEEGEILDSPNKTINFEDPPNESKVKEEKGIKIPPIEDENEQLGSGKNDTAVNEVRNHDINVCKSHLDENLANSEVHNVETTKEIHDSNIDDDCCYADKELESSNIKTANNMKETSDINSVKNVQIAKIDDLSVKNATKEEEMNEPSSKNVAKFSKDNNFVTDNSTCKIDEESSCTKITTKAEAVFNCDTESRDESRASTKSDTFLEGSNKCNTGASHLCLSDHNYNQNPPANDSDVTIEKPPVIPDRHKTVSTVKSTEAQPEEPINVQSIDVKRTVSSLTKNKKDQNKGIVISRRRKAVTLSDSKASMIVLMNIDSKTSITDDSNDNDSVLKPRACKTPRASVKACK